jgi:glycerol-3-phosphate dehydrogenase (NAD(P)+)
MPIIEQINRVLFEDKTAAEAVHELMVRDAGRENADLLWD